MAQYPLHENIDEALKEADKVSRYMLLDSLSCFLHNEWTTLEGNKPEEDIEWLAHRIYKATGGELWEHTGKENREWYMKVAKAAYESLPAMQERMASRYLACSQAIKSYMKMQKAKGIIKSSLL